MNLGTFTKDENGVITGTATTLLSSFEIEYVPTTEKKGNAPDFRVYRRGTEIEIGFATHEVGTNSGKEYLNTLIDTPEWPKAIWAALVKEEDGTYVLKWSRPRPKKNAKKGAERDAEAQSAAASAF